jgi:ABC-type glycerol-3-phosphate transport system permease component
MLMPFVWLLSTSLKQGGTEFTFPPELIPDPVVWRNYPDVLLGKAKFLLLLRNTALVVLLSVFGVTLSSSLSAFGFARLPLPGRGFWFTVLLATLMLPEAVTLIPRFLLFRNLGWIDSWLPLIVPSFGGSAYGIFLLRQFFLTIPRDYDEAARIDGASSLQIWWHVMLPLSQAALITVAVLSFLSHWNAFLDPLIYISTYDKQMVGVGLQLFRGTALTVWSQMMAAAATQILPVLVVFFLAQRYIMRGIVMTGIAGR